MVSNKLSNIIYPEAFNTEFVFVHYQYEEDLKSLLDESGYVQTFIRKYRKCLKFLSVLKTDCTVQSKLFEKLKHHDNLYSIKIFGQKNIRIIFQFIKRDKRTIAVLLFPFQEKDNKQNTATSYETAIEIAQERLKELLEDRKGPR